MINNEEEIESRRQTRRAWRFVVGSVLAVFLIAVFFVFRDAHPPDDSEMQPKFTAGGGPNNPLQKFTKDIEILPDMEWSHLSNSAKDRKIGSEEELQKYLAPHEQAIRCFLELTETDVSEWRWGLEKDDLVSRESSKHLYRTNKVVPLIRTKIILLAREGKLPEAIDMAIRLFRMGYGMERAEGTAWHWQFSISTQVVAIDDLNYILSFSNDDVNLLEQVNSSLKSFSLDRRHIVKETLKTEYLIFRKLTHHHSDLPDVYGSWMENVRRRLLFQENRTLHLYLTYQKPLMDSLDQSLNDYFLASNSQIENLKKVNEDWRSVYGSNATGVKLTASVLNTSARYPQKSMEASLALSTLRVTLALRLYELREGALPDELDQLVPKYIDEVPVDYFDGKQLKYKSKHLLYSVYENQRDDGGNLKTRRNFQVLDYGFYYPWSEQAKEEFNRRYGVME